MGHSHFGIGRPPFRNRANPSSESRYCTASLQDTAQRLLTSKPKTQRSRTDEAARRGATPFRNRANPLSESGESPFGIGQHPFRNRANPSSESRYCTASLQDTTQRLLTSSPKTRRSRTDEAAQRAQLREEPHGGRTLSEHRPTTAPSRTCTLRSLHRSSCTRQP